MAAPKALTTAQQVDIIESYTAGTTSGVLATRHGVHPSTIRNTIRRAGLPLHPRGGVLGRRRSPRPETVGV